MRIKGLFVIFAALILVIMGILAYVGAHSKPLVFYFTEGLIVITFIYLLHFYRKIIKPLDIIGNGMELLREQDFSSRLAEVGQRDADKVVFIFNRMMEQLKEERLRLREQNYFLDLLIDASPMGVLVCSLDSKVVQANPMILKMLGVFSEEIKGKGITEIDTPLAAELAEVRRGETTTIRLNDSNIYKCTHSSFINNGFPHSFYLVESLTEELIKAEKVAYEKVIRMIAHEVNNTTAGITSTLDSVGGALQEIEETEDIQEVMQVCVERCYSMSKFITRFADVVKIPEPHLAPANLNEIAASCKRFMERMCNERGIEIYLETASLPLLNIDSDLFEQVLVNIIKNAAESIESGGEITIRTSASPASIEVVDNGAGITKETEAKLFSPFFSTKPNGQGIGLILIREILVRHGCTFSLRTYADGLTRFRIQF